MWISPVDAKRRVGGWMIMGMQTNARRAERRLEGILNGYPLDYYDHYAASVAQSITEDLRQVMQKYVDPLKMQIVVVAPAKASKEKLSALGEVRVQPMPKAAAGQEMVK
jgi:predicted Zn-dependent peptidase